MSIYISLYRFVYMYAYSRIIGKKKTKKRYGWMYFLHHPIFHSNTSQRKSRLVFFHQKTERRRGNCVKANTCLMKPSNQHKAQTLLRKGVDRYSFAVEIAEQKGEDGKKTLRR